MSIFPAYAGCKLGARGIGGIPQTFPVWWTSAAGAEELYARVVEIVAAMDEKQRRGPRTRRNARSESVTGPHPFHFLGAWRSLAKLTLEDVALHLEVTPPTVHRWETGETPLTVQTWFRLAQLYGAEHPAELSWHPVERDKAMALKKAYELLAKMAPDAREHWLALGASVIGNGGRDPSRKTGG